ncbi:hypothetical protein CVT26_000757 [Gymnopilus dilepis]|uniref:Uncharacterized protein n=1 Tax=Gymnopilus dilepis TaxID=231916 RepID=A0A409Y2L8_9AGAR|nr:hypothetical protein CVT26_000757 [Gymnopilus dilepis]
MTHSSDPLSTAAPLTGTLRYPLKALVELGRQILLNYQAHLTDQGAAAGAKNDEEAKWEASQKLQDVRDITWLLDRDRWINEETAKSPDFWAIKRTETEKKALEEPIEKYTQKWLLMMGVNEKAQDVICEAVKLRREKRGDPLVEARWTDEDALLDFLEFLAKPQHSGLFRTLQGTE